MKLAESDFAMGIKFFAKKINVTGYTFTLSNFKHHLYKLPPLFGIYALNCVCKIVLIV